MENKLFEALSLLLPRVVEDVNTGPLRKIARGAWFRHAEGKTWEGSTALNLPTASIAIEDGLILYALVRATKPKVAVEVGTHCGFSAAFIGAALADNGRGMLHSIEASPWWVVHARENIQGLGLGDSVKVHQGFGVNIMLELLPRLEKVDFFFEDADHVAATIVREVEIIRPFLAEGAYLAFHDSILLESVRGAIARSLEILGPCERLSVASCRGIELLRLVGKNGGGG